MKITVSQSDYAAMVGKSKGVISRAVSEGRLPSELAAGCRGPAVIVEVGEGVDTATAARALWESTASPMPHHQARKAQFDEAWIGGSANPPEKTPQIGDSGPSLVDLMIEETKKGLILDINQFITKPISMPGDYAAPPAGADVSAALKLETWKLQKAKAEQANLELDKMAGLLVERAEVDYVLADFGNTLRSMFEGMADRMSGSVARHRGDVNAIHKEIDDTAHDMLHEMAELMKRKMDGLNA